jgi:hypothetical protein
MMANVETHEKKFAARQHKRNDRKSRNRFIFSQEFDMRAIEDFCSPFLQKHSQKVAAFLCVHAVF